MYVRAPEWATICCVCVCAVAPSLLSRPEIISRRKQTPPWFLLDPAERSLEAGYRDGALAD